jgi:uncharacterized repeat protein (TIGR03899 family)
MAEINLIKLDGKPIEKLVEVISQGIGTIYKPRAIRKEADAKAYKIEIIERAKSKALAEGKEFELETLDRIETRILNKELRRQKNIDNVAEAAAQELKDEENISDEPISEDWSTRFFNIVEDISDKEMQSIWSRILAGEVKKPKSYSLRTLEFLKNLSKDEAMNFVKIAELSFLASGGQIVVFNPDKGKVLKEKFNINFQNLLDLKELGLLHSESNLTLTLNKPEKDDVLTFVYHDKVIVLERENGANETKMDCLVFTKIGIQLLPLIQANSNVEYLKEIKKHIQTDKVQVKIGDLKKLPNGQEIAENIREIN